LDLFLLFYRQENEMIEVESKFSVPADFREQLKAAGARLVASTSFTDTYFDRPDLQLLRKDCWLRQR
jgi:adenylate cyclase class IV